MRERVNPTFEYDRGSVAWAAATMIVCSAAAMFVVDRPAWIVPIAFAAGCVAAGKGGFYDAHANNGFVGVVLAIVPLYAFAVTYRLLLTGDPVLEGDTLFVSLTLGLVDLIAYVPLLLIMGYLGGIVGDAVRRRIGGPIGY